MSATPGGIGTMELPLRKACSASTLAEKGAASVPAAASAAVRNRPRNPAA